MRGRQEETGKKQNPHSDGERCANPGNSDIPIDIRPSKTPSAEANAKSQPKSKRTIVALLGLTLITVTGLGGYWVHQDNVRKAKEQAQLAKEAEEKRLKLEAEAQEAREAQQAREALALAEAQAKAMEEEETRLEMENKVRELETKTMELAKQQQESIRKREQDEAMAKKLQQERRQALSQQQARQGAVAPAAIPPQGQSASATQVMPPQAGSVPVRGPQEKCAKKDNFISRSICEAKACQKPEYANLPFCQQYRERVGNQ